MSGYIRVSFQEFLERLQSNRYASASAARKALTKVAFGPSQKSKGEKSIQRHFASLTEPENIKKSGVASARVVAKKASKRAKVLRPNDSAFLSVTLSILRDEPVVEKVVSLLDHGLQRGLSLRELHDLLVAAA